MNKQAANHRTGERIHQVREHRNISQGRLAKALEVSVGTIQNYEHGRAHITIDRLEQLARALQCEPADLLTSPGTPPPRYRRPRYGLAGIIASVALLLVGGFAPDSVGPPQLTLDLEQLADDVKRINTDDLA